MPNFSLWNYLVDMGLTYTYHLHTELFGPIALASEAHSMAIVLYAVNKLSILNENTCSLINFSC